MSYEYCRIQYPHEIVRFNSPSGIVHHMLNHDDLFLLLSQGINGSLLRLVGQHLQALHNLSNKFDAEQVRDSDQMFGVIGAKM